MNEVLLGMSAVAIVIHPSMEIALAEHMVKCEACLACATCRGQNCKGYQILVETMLPHGKVNEPTHGF